MQVRSGDANIFYEVLGKGPDLVLLHPFPVNHHIWDPIAERLANYYRVILPDLRGHGGSEAGEGPATMTKHAGDVLRVCGDVGVERAVFCGNSIGGYVMMDLWRRSPMRMRGLVFVCSKAQPDAEANLAKRVETINRVRREGTAGVFDGNAQTLIGASTRARRPEVVGELRARMTLTPEAVIAVQAGLATRPDSVPDIAEIDAPVLAICGGEDPGITEAEMRAFESAAGGCEFHLLPDAGHFAAYEQPERVAAIMRPWLAQFEF